VIKKVEDNELETVILQRRSLRATRNLELGQKIQPGDFYPLRPRPTDAIEISPADRILGLYITRDIEEGDYLKEGDVE
jgi:N-acetylneuraminate synthase